MPRGFHKPIGPQVARVACRLVLTVATCVPLAGHAAPPNRHVAKPQPAQPAWLQLNKIGRHPGALKGPQHRHGAAKVRSRRRGRGVHVTRIADSLFSGSMDPTLGRWMSELERSGCSFAEPVALGPLPKEPFMRDLAGSLASRFEVRPSIDSVAGALGDLLAPHFDSHGWLDISKLAQHYGSRRAAELSGLSRGKPSDRYRYQYEGRIAEYGGLLTDLLHEHAPTTINKREMKAFYRLVRQSARHKPLTNWQVHGVQHLLGSTGDMLRAWVAAGAAPEDILIGGKSYSQSQRAIGELQRLGLDLRGSAFRMISGNHLVQQDSEIEEQLASLSYGPPHRKVLIVDDGGRLIKRANAFVQAHPEFKGRIVAVEQTRKGIIELEGVKLEIPVINVAESWAKLRYESPTIGRMVVKSTLEKLSQLKRSGHDPGKHVVLFGYGAVQKAVAKVLRKAGYSVGVYDPKLSASRAASTQGLTIYHERAEALAAGKVVIAATGEQALSEQDLEHLPHGAVLFSAGSADTEITPLAKRLAGYRGAGETTRIVNGRISQRFCGATITIGETNSPQHQDLVLGVKGKELLLANSGFPVNFHGGAHSAHPAYIQLTLGLLHLGALQATTTMEPGLQALKLAPQRHWVTAVNRQLRRQKRGDLLSPTFDL